MCNTDDDKYKTPNIFVGKQCQMMSYNVDNNFKKIRFTA